MAGFLDQDAIRDVAHEVETFSIWPAMGNWPSRRGNRSNLESKDYLTRCMGELEAGLHTGALLAPAERSALLGAIR